MSTVVSRPTKPPKVPRGLKTVLFIIEEMKATGSWDVPTLTRLGEIVAGLDRDRTRKSMPAREVAERGQ